MGDLSATDDRIETVEARTVAVPLRKPPAFSTRAITARHYTIVRVRTKTGVEGMGFCYCGDRAGHLVTQFVRDFLRDHVVGTDPASVEAVWTRMYRDALLMGRRGAVLRAMSAIDMAIWDILAKTRGVPLHKLLGDPKGESVPCYASGGYYWEGVDPVGHVREEVGGYVEAGFEAVKIKVGGLPLEEDLQRARAARQMLGPDRLLMLDANNAWPDVASAIPAINALAEVEPFWVEEPLMPDDIRGHAAIRNAVGVPIATGEIEATRWGFSEILKLEAADVLQSDATVLGGITEFRKVAEMAAEKDVPIYPHAWHQLHVSLVASIPIVMMVEYFADALVVNLGELMEETPQAVNGRLPVPQEPGIGFRFDEGALDRYGVDEWR